MHFIPSLYRFPFMHMRAVYALVILCECVNLVRVENSVNHDQILANRDMEYFQKYDKSGLRL